jgi:hypothetical protein
MARLFTSGFETGAIGNSTNNSEWSAISGTPTPSLVSSPVRSGGWALKINPSANFASVRKFFVPSVTTGTYFFRICLWVDALPSGQTEVANWADASLTSQDRLFVNANGTLTLQATVQSGVPTVVSSALSIQTWYIVEVKMVVSTAGAGLLELRLNGVVQGTTLTSITTITTNLTNWQLGITVSGTATLYYDDIAINDNTGANQNSYPGDGHVTLAAPASDVSVAWLKDGSSPLGTNFAGVSDYSNATPSSAYNSISAAGEDRFGLSTLSAQIGSGDTINVIDVGGNIGSTSASGQTCNFEFWDDGGSKTTGPSVSCASSSFRQSTLGENTVTYPTSKTKAQIQSYNIGYVWGAGLCRVTTFWANIESLAPGVPQDIITVTSPLSLTVQ